jgi:uncharacterized repeat protein (TIGR01451 family)
VATADTYTDSVTVQPGDKIEFLLNVDSIGPNYASFVRILDVLPQGLTYVPFSTTIYDAASQEGITTSPGLLVADILPPSQGKIIKFQAVVASSTAFPSATNVLVNTGRATAGNASDVTDDATITVIVAGLPSAPSPIPSPRPRVLGAAAIDTGFPKWLSILFWSILAATGLAVWQLGYRIYWQKKIILARRNHSSLS